VIDLKFRPITTWPGGAIEPRRSPFRANYGVTLRLLERELDYLGARNVFLQVALDESEIRLDGRPRARATARHPGIILTFDSRYGPLQYATAEFDTWQDNIRAIALGLEALRKVDRYGITKRGEQYTGWKALPAGGNGGVMDTAEAMRIIDRYGGGNIRAAIRATHPDAGGDDESFALVQRAREVLGA
jgi:hypothetical protein